MGEENHSFGCIFGNVVSQEDVGLGASFVDRNALPDWATPDGMPPGLQDKWWRDFWVDSELEDEWLERLNAVPKIQITATCAGHPDLTIIFRKNPFKPVEEVDEPANGPYFVFRPRFDLPFEKLKKAFGDKAAYSEEEINMFDVYDQRLAQKTIVAMTERTWLFGLVKLDPSIVIACTRLREAMGQGEYRRWWENAISAVEEASSKR